MINLSAPGTEAFFRPAVSRRRNRDTQESAKLDVKFSPMAGAGIAGQAQGKIEAELAQLRRMRLASLFEGSTLVILVCMAMPLKYMAGYPLATKIVGSVHGFAFLVYVWVVINTVSGGGWRSGEVLRLLVSAFIPFGAFFNIGFLRRRAAVAARGT